MNIWILSLACHPYTYASGVKEAITTWIWFIILSCSIISTIDIEKWGGIKVIKPSMSIHLWLVTVYKLIWEQTQKITIYKCKVIYWYSFEPNPDMLNHKEVSLLCHHVHSFYRMLGNKM